MDSRRVDMWPSHTRLLRTPGGLAYAAGKAGPSDAAQRVRLVLTHANGFSKEAFAPVLHELSVLLEDSRCAAEWLAVDFSGHGCSRAAPSGAAACWDEYHVDDVLEILSVEAPSSAVPTVGVGHSMGGAVLAKMELRHAGTLRHVQMWEPPLFTRVAAAGARVLDGLGLNPMANATEKRRGKWPSAEAAREHVGGRLGSQWDARSLDAFLAGALRPVEPSGPEVELACSPALEARSLRQAGEPLPSLAATYGGTASFSLVALSESSFSPVGVPGSGRAFYQRLLAPSFPGPHGAAFTEMPGTHLVVMEQPGAVARAIVDDLRRAGVL